MENKAKYVPDYVTKEEMETVVANFFYSVEDRDKGSFADNYSSVYDTLSPKVKDTIEYFVPDVDKHPDAWMYFGMGLHCGLVLGMARKDKKAKEF